MAQQCVEERPVEMFGIVRRLPIMIAVSSGNLDVYELLELAHDGSIVSLFEFVEEELEINHSQFFRGCKAIASHSNKRVLGFVRRDDGLLWTFSRLGSRFKADAPGVVHRERNPGDLILAPAFQLASPPFLPTVFRTKTTIRF